MRLLAVVSNSGDTADNNSSFITMRLKDYNIPEGSKDKYKSRALVANNFHSLNLSLQGIKRKNVPKFNEVYEITIRKIK